MASNTSMTPLQFQPLASQPTPAFWSALTALKIDKFKLDDSAQSITGWMEEGRSFGEPDSSTPRSSQTDIVGIKGSLIVSDDAFGDVKDRAPPNAIPVTGTLKNFNTIEEFRRVEMKKQLFDVVADSMLSSFASPNPILNPFLLVTFADLKKYVYHYWFAFPALISKPAWQLQGNGLIDVLETEVEEIRTLEANMRQQEELIGNAFLLKGSPGQRQVAPLSAYNTFSESVPPAQIVVVFHDPSSLPDNPGWPLRNVLFYLNTVHGAKSLSFIGLRTGGYSRQGCIVCDAPNATADIVRNPQAVGWERDKHGNLTSRVADLGPIMNPANLAEQAVDLNLKLMRWRVMPSLELDKISNTRCLLLGAGTLGCYVARALMGWGVRTITFVDSGTVAFSNPVRQPLFDFDDCLGGGKPKAICAAEHLKKIFPGINATGHSLSIPMPGHPVHVTAEKDVAADVTSLHDLIRSHDAIFILMDSRESRWLPTVMGAAENKIVINAALGFDSYLVMRHGGRASFQSGHPLGCYFCNDVVAPADVSLQIGSHCDLPSAQSLTDRTLDQMCTVTRPGVAPIASAFAVEMLISLLQHPLGVEAPAGALHSGLRAFDQDHPHEQMPLGEVPHQLRGNVQEWRTLSVEGAAYDKCTGCSPRVLNAFKGGEFEFLSKVFNDAAILEEVTGLDVLQAESEALMDSFDWDESDGES